MFDLYDIYDTSEITIIILMVFIFILVLVVFMLFLFSKGSNINIPIELPKKEIDYEKKYNDLIEKKGEVPQNQVKYSPSEFSTLLKYNPILPYSAFTWDIINNAYLDFNERSNYDDRYFSLANYDNIYQSTNSNPVTNSNTESNLNSNTESNLNSNTDKLSRIMENVNRYKKGDNNNNGLLDESYKKKNLY